MNGRLEREGFTTLADMVQDFQASEQIKKLTKLITQNIDLITSNIEEAKEYGDFARIKKQINDTLQEMFLDMLSGKPKDFIDGFEQGNISKYITEHESEKIDLIKLLGLKNKFYNDILKTLVVKWKLDGILSLEEREDIVNTLNSGIFSFLDDIYINRYQELYNGKNDGIKAQKLSYGWVKDGKVVPLKDLSDTPISIDIEKLEKIHNPHMRSYFLKFAQLICQWVTDYQTWVDAEVHEVKSWQDRNSIFGFVGPMEDYMYPTVLVEPELLLCLRNIKNTTQLEDFCNLSEEYYGEKYGMDHMTLDVVESLLHTGDATFWPFLGKAFPNDNTLSQKEWNCIILRDTRMRLVVENSQKAMTGLFGNNFVFNQEALYSELLKEVSYHEFGHSLFVKWHWSSELEELKATLFYYLKLWDENTQKSYEAFDIKKVVEFAVMDSIRNLERINDSSSKKYVILTKIILWALFDSEVLTWENDLLFINTESDRFDRFLGVMHDELDGIKMLYAMDDEQRIENEAFRLKINEEFVRDHISRMLKIIKKTNA